MRFLWKMSGSASPAVVCTSSESGTGPRTPGTVSCKSWSMRLRWAGANCRMIGIWFAPWPPWKSPSWAPYPAAAKVCTTAAGATPCKADFSRSMSMEIGQGLHDSSGGNPVQGRFLAIDVDGNLGRGRVQGRIDVHDALGGVKGHQRLSCQAIAFGSAGTVDLRHQGVDHGWTRRNQIGRAH